MTNYISELRAKLAARSGVCFVQDEDEYRLSTKTHQAAVQEGYELWRWTSSDGLVPVSPSITEKLKEAGENERSIELKKQEWATLTLPVGNARMPGLLDTVKNWKMGPAIVLASDLWTMTNRLPSLPMATRLVKDITDVQQSLQADEPDKICQLVICDMEKPALPCTMQKLSLELPDRAEMASILDSFIESADDAGAKHAKENRDRILNALAGLPAYQAGNALAEARSRTGVLDPDILRSYKKEMVAAKGITWIDVDSQDGFERLGGLTPLKSWLKKRAAVMMNEEARREYGVGTPKGVICAGIPGAGKSFAARCLASFLGVPLLRVSLGDARGKYVGDSERSLQDILDTCSALPCVMHLDEVEKQLGGAGGQSAEADGGIGSRMLGTFLTWLQENENPVFIYMTANNPAALPPELTRAGRVSGQFWFDFPSKSERSSIIDIMIKRYPKAAAVAAVAVLTASKGYTGAEIETAFEEGAIVAMLEKRDMTTEDVVSELRRVKKVKDTFDMTDALEKWRNAAQDANDGDAETETPSTTPSGAPAAPRHIVRTR